MKHGAKNHSNTRKILNNNNVHTHAQNQSYMPTLLLFFFFFFQSRNEIFLSHCIQAKFLKTPCS